MACTRGWSSFLREEGEKMPEIASVLVLPELESSVGLLSTKAGSRSNSYLSAVCVPLKPVLCLPLFSFSVPLNGPARRA